MDAREHLKCSIAKEYTEQLNQTSAHATRAAQQPIKQYEAEVKSARARVREAEQRLATLRTSAHQAE